MKRLASGILCIAIVLCAMVCMPIKADAATSGTSGSCTWTLDGTTLTIFGNGPMASYYTGSLLTTAPWGNEVTHVIIENGVTTVGQYAFFGCSKLQSVTIPSSVTKIDRQAFDRSGVSSVKLSEGLTTIYDGAFNSCESLRSIVLPKSLTYIGDYAFQSCPITSIVFSTNLKYIGNSAFNYGSVVDVWYLGNQSDKAGMTIKGYNACLNTATWHYDSCPVGAPHSFDNECDKNCNGCGMSRTVPDHVYDNACDDACNICSAKRSTEHQYTDACDTKCNICQVERVVPHFYDSGKITQPATCGAEGVKTYTCTACNSTKTEPVEKTTDHKYSSWTKVNDTTHKHTCSVCSNEETANHTWNSGAVTKKATCKEDGVKTYTCTACNATMTETIAKLTTHTYDHACDADCNVCGTTRTITHNYNTSWSKDKTNHWHECSICKDKKDIAAHTPGAEATETTAQTCTTCGYIIKATLGHKHSYADTWTTDDSGHWHKCSGCEEKDSYAAHVFENDCDTDCSICSYKRETKHKFTETWTTDANNHWHVCSGCGLKQDESAHEPGAEATTTTAQTCTICSYEITPALGVEETTTPTESTDTTAPTIPTDKTEPHSSSFPWWVIIVGAIVAVGGAVAVIATKKKKDKQSQSAMTQSTATQLQKKVSFRGVNAPRGAF